ncbi:2-phosphosulfolactate phosphatase [Peristeroidobacter agariperforans]|uniref:2-phosphosulfolactate phosphatase n=1 Tax=Peristeroidobacter agariperforans TaxID=268404 RepID=UPI00101E0EF0|nr:2-phosphosulfolactate phosphatase [Peristeroidobacter agariperforans]
MQVKVADHVAGAQSAEGIVVVIDVFRAFSVAAYAFSRGAAAVIPVAEVDYARQLKREHPDWFLIGERHARPLPGFDCGNSPADLEKLDVAGRTLIHTTHAGTQGLTNARQADEVLTGALVNAGAIVRYIQARQPSIVTLVRMGHEARENCDEDDLCAELLRSRLLGEPMTAMGIRERLRKASSAEKFFDPACDWAPERDFDLCTRVDEFDFVLQLETGVSPPRLRKIDVPKPPIEIV